MKKIVTIIITTSIVIYLGIFLRLTTNVYSAKEFYVTNNVVSYYVDITNRLIETGKIPKIDVWRYSDDVMVENAPPFLAILTNFLYQFIKFFDISPLVFIAHFNILIYVIFIILGSMYFYKKLPTIYPMLIFQILLTFLPFSISLQNFGKYTEEFLGVFLIFIVSICEIERNNNKIYRYFEIMFLILLLLTWQQFHLICFIIFLSNLMFRRALMKETILIFIFVFIGAEIVSRVLFDSNYSPVMMIYEAIYPMLKMDSSSIEIAMRRNDWRYLSWNDIVEYLSYAGISIWVFSLINFILKKNKEYHDKYIFLGMTMTILLTYVFIKSRYISLSFLLLFCSTNYQIFVIKDFKQVVRISKNIMLISLLAIMTFFIFNHKLFINYDYQPIIEDRIVTKKQGEDTFLTTITLKNVGGDQTPDKDSFAGYHVEIFNAKVHDIKSIYTYGKSDIIIKNDAQMENYYWFEAKYFSFVRNSVGSVSFILQKIDTSKPITILYRSWIPGYCSIVNRYETMSTMLKDYSQFGNSWRNEKCIVRSPSNISFDKSKCSYKVYAGHVDRQEFYCNMKILH